MKKTLSLNGTDITIDIDDNFPRSSLINGIIKNLRIVQAFCNKVSAGRDEVCLVQEDPENGQKSVKIRFTRAGISDSLVVLDASGKVVHITGCYSKRNYILYIIKKSIKGATDLGHTVPDHLKSLSFPVIKIYGKNNYYYTGELFDKVIEFTGPEEDDILAWDGILSLISDPGTKVKVETLGIAGMGSISKFGESSKILLESRKFLGRYGITSLKVKVNSPSGTLDVIDKSGNIIVSTLTYLCTPDSVKTIIQDSILRTNFQGDIPEFPRLSEDFPREQVSVLGPHTLRIGNFFLVKRKKSMLVDLLSGAIEKLDRYTEYTRLKDISMDLIIGKLVYDQLGLETKNLELVGGSVLIIDKHYRVRLNIPEILSYFSSSIFQGYSGDNILGTELDIIREGTSGTVRTKGIGRNSILLLDRNLILVKREEKNLSTSLTVISSGGIETMSLLEIVDTLNKN